MRYERFAFFENADAAESAMRDLSSRAELNGFYSVALHRDQIEGETSDPALAPEERGIRSGARFGAILGALLAGALGAFMEAHSRLFGAGWMAGAFVGLGVGALVGGFIGAIVGSGYSDPNLQDLAAQLKKGRAVASVSVEGLPRLWKVEYLLRRNHAALRRRAIF